MIHMNLFPILSPLVYVGFTKALLCAPAYRDLPWSDEVISYPKMPGDKADNEEPVMTINFADRQKIDRRLLI